MKKLLLSISILLVLCPLSGAWDEMGHALTAAIAENHLSASARKALNQYLDGMSIVLYSSDTDICRADWLVDLGFVPSNLERSKPAWIKDLDRNRIPDNMAVIAHMFAVDGEMKPYESCNVGGKYVPNAIWHVDQIARQLKEEAPTMDPELRKRAICVLVHLVGDFHCPSHIYYGGVLSQPGNIKVNGIKCGFHQFWDHLLDQDACWSCFELADMIDNASKKERAEITAGTVYDWAEDSARCCHEVNQTKTGDTFRRSYIIGARELCLSQARKAGYRLAAILNEIF